MKYLMFILMVLTPFVTFPQDSCVIKVFPNDCINCYIGMSKIISTGEGIKKTIVFPKLSKAEVNAYLRNVLNISDPDKYTIIVSDSLYNSLDNNLTSEVFMFDNGTLNDNVLLKKFHGFNKSDSFSIVIPDTIPISNSATLINNKDYFFINDPKFGNNIFINKYDNKISILKAQDFTTKSIFNKIAGDTLCYNMFSKYRDIFLKGANLDKIRFYSTNGKNMMTSFILLPNLVKDSNNFNIYFKIGIVLYENPNTYKILSINDKTLPKKYRLSIGTFAENKGNYYFNIVTTDTNSNDQYLLGKFKLINDRLEFIDFADYKIPSEYLPVNKFEHLSKVFILSNPYFFLQFSRSYYNIENNKTYQLPLDSVNLVFEYQEENLKNAKIETKYSIIDSYVFKDTIQLLIKESDNYVIAYINRAENRLIKKVRIENPKRDNIKIGRHFYSKDKLIYLTNDNKIVVEKIEYQKGR